MVDATVGVAANVAAPKKAAKKVSGQVNIKIKSMNGKFATGGFFVAAGEKITPEDVCAVDEDLSKKLLESDKVEATNKKATCTLIDGEIIHG